MHRRNWVTIALLFTVMVSMTDFAEAQRRGRRRRGRANANNGFHAAQGPNWPAAKIDSASAAYRPLSISYSYDDAISPDAAFNDRIRVFLRIADSEALAAGKDVVAEVKIADLNDYETIHVQYVPLTILGHRKLDENVTLASLDVGNDDPDQPIIKAARVYRLFINLHHKSDVYNDQSVLGRIPSPYYISTSGDTALERARRQIVIRTFKEWYYTEWGWWSNEQYVMDCYAFYMWATGSCTVGADYGHTRLDRLFSGGIPYHAGAHIAQLSAEAAIQGDYVRIPGHSFMILAYDSEKHQVVTMEGNYNNSLEIVVRPVDGSWTVGHLVGEHIRAELFTDDPKEETMASRRATPRMPL